MGEGVRFGSACTTSRGGGVQASQNRHGNPRGDCPGLRGAGDSGAGGASPQPCLPSPQLEALNRQRVRALQALTSQGRRGPSYGEAARPSRGNKDGNLGHFCPRLTVGSDGGRLLTGRSPGRALAPSNAAGRQPWAPVARSIFEGPASPCRERPGLKGTASPKDTPALRSDSTGDSTGHARCGCDAARPHPRLSPCSGRRPVPPSRHCPAPSTAAGSETAGTEQNKEFLPEPAVLPLLHRHAPGNPQTQEPLCLLGCRSRPPPATAGRALAAASGDHPPVSSRTSLSVNAFGVFSWKERSRQREKACQAPGRSPMPTHFPSPQLQAQQ